MNLEVVLKNIERRAFELQKPDGSWIGEVELNAGPTAQAVIVHHALRLPFPAHLASKAKWYILRTQRASGGWGTFDQAPDDVSVGAECYVALRLLGEGADSESCRKARDSIASLGGIAATNPWTQLYLAVLGVLRWELLQKIPVEVALTPSWSPTAIEKFAYWVKVITPPMMLVHAVGPGEPIALAPELAKELKTGEIATFAAKGAMGKMIYSLLRMNAAMPLPYLRKRAIRGVLNMIDEFTERSGDFGGNTCTAVNVLLGLDRLGLNQDDRFKNGLRAMMDYGIETEGEWHLQTCQSHTWDTAFTLSGLAPSGDPKIQAACDWLLSRQILDVRGPWSMNVGAEPGGWCFGNRHEHFPVTDCTAISLIALARHRKGFHQTEAAKRGVAWLLGMQHASGGWAAYEKYVGGDWVNRFLSFKDIPNALVDLPKADVSSKVIEALCAFREHFPEIEPALAHARAYLLQARTPQGLWRGNYGVNYIYGTAFAARALRAIDGKPSPDWAEKIAEFYLASQNADGGWGESDRSYSDEKLIGKGPSSPVQTSWALLGLHAASDDPRAKKAIEAGMRYLASTQRQDGQWEEPLFLGTVFPEKVYFKYELYPLYFPLIALGEVTKRD